MSEPVFIGYDPAAGKDTTVVVCNARRFGKAERHRRELAAFLATNLDAVIVHVGEDGVRVEKPVHGEATFNAKAQAPGAAVCARSPAATGCASRGNNGEPT